MRTTLTTLQSLNPDRVSNVLAEMNSIEGKLDNARNLYIGGDISGSIRVLQQADTEFKDVFSRMNGYETRYIMNLLDQLTNQMENEVSPTEKLRLQKRIQSTKDMLASRLEMNALESTNQPPETTNDSQTITP
jgi:hypothetical protein